MICSRCKKRIAVVFISSIQGNEKKSQGLCLTCAKELGVPQVDEYMKELGIDDEEFEAGLNDLFTPLNPELKTSEDGEDDDDDDSETEDDDFEDDEKEDLTGFKAGGAMPINGLFANFLRSMPNDSTALTPTNKPSEEDTKTKKKEEKKQKKEEKKYKFLDTFCTNLTAKARRGELDNVVGREKEMARVLQILSRRQKNNPCLIGEPGVGKTAIAEGIAQKLVANTVPFRLSKKELYLLDLTALVAGTQFRGQFESRVKSLIDDVKHAGNVILFIDEVHNLVGAGDSDGTMNAGNMFKPALSRGELQVIGATTFNEYRKYIEKDSALERRFQPVTVNEPTIDETVELLKGIKKYYEEHHKIHVSDKMLRECAVLSERYINDRFLPDKAIDLLDESAAYASIKSLELAEFEELKQENTDQEQLEKELAGAKEIDYERIADIKTQLAKRAVRIAELEPIVSEINVTEEDICKVIELWTGIPSSKILETEFKRIGKLEEVLKSKIIGQDEVCSLVANAIKRNRVQLFARRRPASFIFVGPTGVGKTEMVKVLASELFDSVEPLIRLDMSEFMEKHSISKIIGSPPGYVGYDEAGQLTEKVRRRPYSVILFDEIEKAHPDVMNILLQILDEGKVNDAHGRSVNFENTVIAMTSNAGSSDKSTGLGFGKTMGDISKEKAMKALKEFLRPEFLSRVDEIAVFKPLSEESCCKIARLMLLEMETPLEEKEIELIVTDEACKYIAKNASGGLYGGRDIRRIIRKEVEDPVASLIIEKAGEKVTTLTIDGQDDKLALTLV